MYLHDSAAILGLWGHDLGEDAFTHMCNLLQVTCNSRPIQPLMSDLPKDRITPSPPFTHCVIDFAGPFAIKTATNWQKKAYLSVFVCFSTKAVHLQVVLDLSGEHAFER